MPQALNSCDCRSNELSAQRAAKAYGIPLAYDDVDRMLKELPELDAVSIIVPNCFHAPLAIKALSVGKHVFCEKPPALNASETKKMCDAAKKFGRTLMFNFNTAPAPNPTP